MVLLLFRKTRLPWKFSLQNERYWKHTEGAGESGGQGEPEQLLVEPQVEGALPRVCWGNLCTYVYLPYKAWTM